MLKFFLLLAFVFLFASVLLSFNEILDFDLSHFEHTFNNVRCACDHMVDVIFADLVVEFF